MTEAGLGSPDAKSKGAKTQGRKRGGGADPQRTKDDLVEAAISGIVIDGFARTTARSIGARAGCNQAAIYYHFGGIEELLLTALQLSSDRCLQRYKTALPGAESVQDLVLAIEKLYNEDRESGHLSLLTELVGGVAFSTGLRAGVEAATGSWIDFVEEQIEKVVHPLPFGSVIPARDVADLVFSLVTGVEMRSKVDGSTERADRLFRMARLAAALVDSQGKAT